MDVRELAEALKNGEGVTVLDVREADELAIAPFPGAVHVPLRELPARIAELPATGRLAVLCHHGMRSAMAVSWLASQGRADVVNVDGGIDAWSLVVDATLPRY